MKIRLLISTYSITIDIATRSNVNDHLSGNFKSVVMLAKTMEFEQVPLQTKKMLTVKICLHKGKVIRRHTHVYVYILDLGSM